jgi:hypothetical protein
VGCLITYFRTAGRGKFIFGGQVGETVHSTALPGSDPNYLGKASMEGIAVVRCEFGHVGDGRRADSSTGFPGASSSLCTESPQDDPVTDHHHNETTSVHKGVLVAIKYDRKGRGREDREAGA